MKVHRLCTYYPIKAEITHNERWQIDHFIGILFEWKDYNFCALFSVQRKHTHYSQEILKHLKMLK